MLLLDAAPGSLDEDVIGSAAFFVLLILMALSIRTLVKSPLVT